MLPYQACGTAGPRSHRMRRRISVRSSCGSATSSSCGMTLEAGDHRCTGRLIGPYHVAQVLGIELRDTSVEPTRSTNIALYRPTVTAAWGQGTNPLAREGASASVRSREASERA